MLRKILASAALMPMLLACAPFAQADMQTMSPEQISLVDSTCTQVMGLKKGEAYFAPCRESLSQALAAKTEGQSVALEYSDCRHRGLAEGTSALSTCMLDSKVRAPEAKPAAFTYSGAPGMEAGKSFYDVTPTVRWNRERYSCAELGLLPGSGAFGQCVASLEGAFMPSTD